MGGSRILHDSLILDRKFSGGERDSSLVHWICLENLNSGEVLQTIHAKARGRLIE
jgi:hypothetical protein